MPDAPNAVPANVARFLANETVLADASKASVASGLYVSVILAQWGNETAWGTSYAWTVGHNFAGISSGGRVLSYGTYAEGLAAYVETIRLPWYDGVRAARPQGVEAQAKALGASPWAGGHYEGQGGYAFPGGALVEEIQLYDLERFDAGAVGHPKPPPAPFSKLEPALAARIVASAFELVLGRTATTEEWHTWTTALEAGVREPAQLVEELTLEPQSFLSPLVRRDAVRS